MPDENVEPKKPLRIWEHEHFMVLNDIKDDSTLLDKDITVNEFTKLSEEKGFVGVNVPDRIKFLEDNGYEVTRANLVNPELIARKA